MVKKREGRLSALALLYQLLLLNVLEVSGFYRLDDCACFSGSQVFGAVLLVVKLDILLEFLFRDTLFISGSEQFGTLRSTGFGIRCSRFYYGCSAFYYGV